MKRLSIDHIRLSSILKNFSGRNIGVIGDVGVDRYTSGEVERISPEAPVPIVAVTREELKLGLAANVADNIVALKGRPWLAGVVGKDRGAEDFRKLLRARGIGHQNLVEDRSRRTVLKERIVSGQQQLLRVDYEDAASISDGTRKQVLSKISDLVARVEVIIIEDYAKGLLSEDTIQKIIKMAGKKPVLVDPNAKTPAAHYKGAFLLTPNRKEAEALCGFAIRDGEDIRRACQALIKMTAAQHAIITLGKDGMAIGTKGTSKLETIPTFAREVYDVSGAGDTVIAVLALALATGAKVEEAAILGNLAASVEVAKRGTATVSQDEISTAMDLFGKEA